MTHTADLAIAKTNLLKRVQIRISFEGLTDIQTVVEELKGKDLSTKFGSYRKLVRPLDNPIGALPEPVHVFYNYQPSDDVVELVLSTSSMTLSIDCNDYKGIDPFLELTEIVVTKILASDTFAIVKRIELKKMAADRDEKIDNLFTRFNPEAFGYTKSTTPGITELSSDYKNELVFNTALPIPIMVSHRRISRAVRTPQGSVEYQAILEIEGLANEKVLQRLKLSAYPSMVTEILHSINKFIIEMISLSLNEKYLKSHDA
ncbi:MAG: hypothetical protein JFR41_10815 [Muribaculaceae bacterium]|nr:hypothetical protein [Muribaculaceae bacterium]